MKKTYITPTTTTLSLSMEQMVAQSPGTYSVDFNQLTNDNWAREKGFASGWNSQLWADKETEETPEK